MKKVIMLDLETLATTPNAAVIQIAALALIPNSGCHPDELNVFVRGDVKGDIDSQTIAFHIANGTVMNKGVNAATAASRVCDFFFKHQDADEIWVKGASFDFPILRNFIKRNSSRTLELDFRKERCLRTFLALTKKTSADFSFKNKKPHDALEDCAYQLDQLRDIYRELREGVKHEF